MLALDLFEEAATPMTHSLVLDWVETATDELWCRASVRTSPRPILVPQSWGRLMRKVKAFKPQAVAGRTTRGRAPSRRVGG